MSDMAKATRKLAEIAVRGPLDSWLQRQHSEGRSNREIAEELTNLGAPVSYETVRTWLLEIDEVQP